VSVKTPDRPRLLAPAARRAVNAGEIGVQPGSNPFARLRSQRPAPLSQMGAARVRPGRVGMSSNPISRLQLACAEIDKALGPGFAQQHPELVAVVVSTAASDWAASRLAVAIERVAEALLVEEETQRIVPAHELLRARP
jgi:hypothetical protein